MPRQVTLVCGPPCSGKSTFVTEHAQEGDLVLCVDEFAQAEGSPVAHNHTGHYFGLGQKRFQEACRQVRQVPDAKAWVVRCAPEPKTRRDLAVVVGATKCVVLLPPIHLVGQRAKARDDAYEATWAAIRSWYSRYRPAYFDTVITGGI